MGKATIMKPKEPLYHRAPIPANFFKVSMASVKPGHENLPPPVLLGDDDETPWRLGDCCNGWVLLWPKSLFRLEAAGSTHTSTQLGMNINTPPTQLVSAVMLGDSGRGEEEAPIVAGDVPIDEDEDDDGTQQYVYTGVYSGSERHESVPELPPPESGRIMDDLPVAKKSRKRQRKGNKAASMIQPPHQPRVQDRIDIPGAAKWNYRR